MQTNTKTDAVNAATDALPSLQNTIMAAGGVNKGFLHPNGKAYFLNYYSASVVAKDALLRKIPLPDLHPPLGQILSDIGFDSQSGLVYVLDRAADAIHVISETTLITTLVGIAEQPRMIVEDQDSNEVYIFYTSQTRKTDRFRALIMSGTTVVAETILPASPWAVKYNPIDGHIYGAGEQYMADGSQSNALFVIDNHRVITTILPLDSNPQLGVVDMAINPENGDVHVLLSTKVVTWDRVNPPYSVNLLEAGYKNPQCITVDPTRELLYVCSWMEKGSYALVMTKERFKTAIPIKKWPEAIAWDRKHDYVYIAHYDPTNLSIIRGTDLITTLDIVGFGTSNIVVDEDGGRIYTANADDGSISVFGFDQADKPSFWQRFLPFIQR